VSVSVLDHTVFRCYAAVCILCTFTLIMRISILITVVHIAFCVKLFLTVVRYYLSITPVAG